MEGELAPVYALLHIHHKHMQNAATHMVMLSASNRALKHRQRIIIVRAVQVRELYQIMSLPQGVGP